MTISYGSNPVEHGYYLFDFDTTDITTGVTFLSLPQSARIIRGAVQVLTAFNAGGANNLNVGISASGSEMTTGQSLATTGEFVFSAHFTTANLKSPLSSARTLYARYTQTGTAATTGKAVITVLWVRVAV